MNLMKPYVRCGILNAGFGGNRKRRTGEREKNSGNHAFVPVWIFCTAYAFVLF
jgi:hypothetical protein